MDYLRAIDEYNFYLKFNKNDTVEFKIAQSLFHMKKYFESSKKFKNLTNKLILTDDAELGYYKSIFFIGNFNSFRTQLNQNNQGSQYRFQGRSDSGVAHFNFTSTSIA